VAVGDFLNHTVQCMESVQRAATRHRASRNSPIRAKTY